MPEGTPMDEKTVEVRITGRVQGVGFRAWTEGEARRRSLGGWVRNAGDGSVEARFAGPAGSVDEMVDLCRQGPAVARVDAVEIREAEKGFSVDFRIRY